MIWQNVYDLLPNVKKAQTCVVCHLYHISLYKLSSSTPHPPNMRARAHTHTPQKDCKGLILYFWVIGLWVISFFISVCLKFALNRNFICDRIKILLVNYICKRKYRYFILLVIQYMRLFFVNTECIVLTIHDKMKNIMDVKDRQILRRLSFTFQIGKNQQAFEQKKKKKNRLLGHLLIYWK